MHQQTPPPPEEIPKKSPKKPGNLSFSSAPPATVRGHDGRLHPVGQDPRIRKAYSFRKKLLIVGTLATLIALGMLTSMFIMARSTPAQYQAWRKHMRQVGQKQLQKQATEIESMVLGDLLTPPAPSHASQPDAGSTAIDGQTDVMPAFLAQVKVEKLGTDEQGRALRSVQLGSEAANIWLAANFESWLAYRDFDMPSQISNPMVSMDQGVSTLHFTINQGSVSQTFQADFKINLDDQGLATLRLDNLHAGTMPVPVDALGRLAATAADAAAIAPDSDRLGPWISKLQQVRFKPAIKFPDGLKGQLLDYRIDDDTLTMTMRIERYRPSSRKQIAEAAPPDEH